MLFRYHNAADFIHSQSLAEVSGCSYPLRHLVTEGSCIIRNILCLGPSSTLLKSDHLEVSLWSVCITWMIPAFWNNLFHCFWSLQALWAGAVQRITAAVAAKRRGDVRGLLWGFAWSRRQGHRQGKVHHVEHIAQTSRHLERQKQNLSGCFMRWFCCH